MRSLLATCQWRCSLAAGFATTGSFAAPRDIDGAFIGEASARSHQSLDKKPAGASQVRPRSYKGLALAVLIACSAIRSIGRRLASGQTLGLAPWRSGHVLRQALDHDEKHRKAAQLNRAREEATPSSSTGVTLSNMFQRLWTEEDRRKACQDAEREELCMN